ncbi:E3 SUMO-protein ligase KIAA1586-like [Cydia splendana]|uniref:E3 SUMO-protein ligase KIAA1586-like n=1 Tax=Cydia splendana TaxID=1100963 RepID=UPI00300C6B01
MLIANMKEDKFSIIIDESTDRGVVKHLCLVVRLTIDNEVCDYFYDLIPIEGASAIDLYNHVVNSFDKDSIPWRTNLIGFASDGANNLMGNNHSVSTLLKDEVPNIFILKCICHSFALCASYACAKLPQMAEDLVKDLYNYIQSSPKRIGDLKMFQTFLQIKPHKLLHPSQTRWLSLHAAVARVLEQYNALKLFFIDAVSQAGSSASARHILDNMNNPYIKLYLLFLDFILPHFNNLNKLMQSETVQIHNLRKNIISVLKTILEFYIKPSYLESTDIESVNYRNPSNFLELKDIYMGAKVEAVLNTNNYPDNDIQALKLKIMNFYIEGVTQIYKRFPFTSPVLKLIEVLDPKIVKEKKYNSLAPLAMQFPNIVEASKWQELDDQWRLLRNTTSINFDETDIPKFWHNVGKEKIGDEEAFPTLSKFMNCLMVLPHSSAAVERVFSAINLNKTKQRNCLNTKTLCGIMHSKRLYNKSSCFAHNINNKMLSLFNKNMYEDGDGQHEEDIN